jgi:uncharacterized protein YjbJ (UPF0337 family)
MKNASLLESNNMNTIEEKRSWEKQKSELIQKFAILTDNDLIFEEGEKEEMFKKLRIRLGKTKEELKKIISAF